MYVHLLLEREHRWRKLVSGRACGRRKAGKRALGGWHSNQFMQRARLAKGSFPSPLPQGMGPRCHFFTTWFACKLWLDNGYNYDGVRRCRACLKPCCLPRRLGTVAEISLTNQPTTNQSLCKRNNYCR